MCITDEELLFPVFICLGSSTGQRQHKLLRSIVVSDKFKGGERPVERKER